MLIFIVKLLEGSNLVLMCPKLILKIIIIIMMKTFVITFAIRVDKIFNINKNFEIHI